MPNSEEKPVEETAKAISDIVTPPKEILIESTGLTVAELETEIKLFMSKLVTEKNFTFATAMNALMNTYVTTLFQFFEKDEVITTVENHAKALIEAIKSGVFKIEDIEPTSSSQSSEAL